MEPLLISIDVTKIDKTAIYEGKKGKYLSLIVWPNRNGISEYGDIATVKQDFGKDRREESKNAPIVGNVKPLKKLAEQSKPADSHSGGSGEEDILF